MIRWRLPVVGAPMVVRARAGWRWLLLGLLLLGGVARADLLELRQAMITVQTAAAEQTQAVRLPYHWDRGQAGEAGEARLVLHFALAAPPQSPYGILLRSIGNAYEIWLNGTLLARAGELRDFGGANYAGAPQYVNVPGGLLGERNELRILLRADAGRRAGLTPPLVGPDTELLPIYQRLERWHVLSALLLAMLSLIVGLLALALWQTQVVPDARGRPRRQPLYLYAGIGELAWALRVGDKMIISPPLDWPAWNAVQVLAFALWLSFMMLFCIVAVGWGDWRRLPALRLALALYCASGAVCGWLAVTAGWPLLLTLWYALAILLFVPFAVVFVAAAWRRGASAWHRWLAAALLLNVVVGLRDWYAFRLGDSFGEQTWQRYSGVLFGLLLGYIVLTRFRAASAQARELSVHLAERVAQKEAELAESYARMGQLAREQARASERTRILRDMHDGVGAHISAAIRQLQSGQASRGELLSTLRESLDQLKLSIDALHLDPGDVTTLLANLRYRLEPRLQAAGIALEWDVALLQPLARLDDGAMRQLQYMVLELLSNVLQHAHASRLRIEARPEGVGARLRVIDNGRGFDTTQPGRNGLRSLRERAQAIGARLHIHSQPGATRVEIEL
ncbi:MAG TPA: sensor histidine kinase [Ottowia sp.]|uniref:sensor histidine kinase n=1 Tax=Ottowia sp. TaxID=1898956 RepID=UPI002CE02616|nr:sensor histidine kinase [Ottowia sp.]HMN22354.1 sensor histidine kinase [Ottowia sp.]